VVPWHQHLCRMGHRGQVKHRARDASSQSAACYFRLGGCSHAFAANTKAFMTSGILKVTFQKMDELGITQRGADKNGITYCPAAVSLTDTSPRWGKTTCGT
jgi:hypothetical protein